MIIRYIAEKDPLFKGTWENYHMVVSSDINEHLASIKHIIMEANPIRNKLKNKNKVTFYSVPDSLGMRFMRFSEDLDEGTWWILSDFRFEWSKV